MNKSSKSSQNSQSPNHNIHVSKSPAVSPAYAFNQKVADRASKKALSAKPRKA